MARKRAMKASQYNNVFQLEQALIDNGRAYREGPTRKKSWSKHDIKHIKALTPPQREMIHDYIEGQNIIASGSAGTGKAQPLYTKIMTPFGWKTMGELKIGDLITTPSGDIAPITGVFPQGKRDTYRIMFSDGSSTECCLEHLWNCYVPHDMYNSKGSTYQTVNTQFIMEWLDAKAEAKKQGKRVVANISIPLTQPVEQSEKPMLIDPYLLGALLGDGCVCYSSPIMSSADPEVLEQIALIIDEEYHIKKIANSLYDYKIQRKHSANYGPTVGMQSNGYTDKFKELGLYGKRSHEKFIPDSYMVGSITQRLHLLQGLMDTDGTVDKKSKGCSLTTTSSRLAADVQQLVWSLGGKASVSVKTPSYRYNGIKKTGRLTYTVSVSLRDPSSCFRLKRKQELCNQGTYQEKQFRRQVVSVTKIGHCETQCIMVDHPDHLYITDDYIVTHNTFIGLYLALCDILSNETDRRHIIIVRSAVPTRDLGFTPGTLEEKAALYEAPYASMFAELIGRSSTYQDMKEAEIVDFQTTSYIRGVTWDNAVIVVDECQSMTFHELNTIMTRLGQHSRIILCGDLPQTDLRKKTEVTGMDKMLRIASKMRGFTNVTFTKHDIVRSEFVKQWITACEEEGD